MGSLSLLSTVAKRLEGKVALITGGASGIGESTAKLFHHHGAKIIIADIQDDLGHSVCQELGPKDSSFIHCDVRDEDAIQNAIKSAITKYGKLDIMFNNAGIVDELKTNILDNEKYNFERVLSVNITGVFLGIKNAARVMVPARRGSIISTASVCSISGGAASHAYTCSKHAVVGLMKNATVELGQFGIRVNCISPYVIATPLTKDPFKLEIDEDGETYKNVYSNLKGEVLKPRDIAEAALYLGSDESRYVSGHNLVVDGGYTIVNPAFGMYTSHAS
ncbi:secoisolariciresinol dehydrogenase-like isoform X1 [Tasmannia lanceolata]|uniref:secoisolariciresinol dehydrogenase-like isoform X1 n=1 Tax=Tasmannia lanceolata TaxID=3420 RepID=UPI004062CA3C